MVFTEGIYNEFKEFLEKKDEKMYNLVCKLGFLKPLPSRNWFAILIGNIIGQKIRFKKARELRGKLYTKMGTANFGVDDFKDKFEGETISLKQSLLELGIEGWQVDIIVRVYEYIISNETKWENIDDLLNVKGIGPWTLRNTKLMYSLQTLPENSIENSIENGIENNIKNSIENVLLTRDLIIRRGIEDLYGVSIGKEYRKLEKLWSPYCGLVTWYLWKEYS